MFFRSFIELPTRCGSKRASHEFSSRLKFAPWYAKGSDLRDIESLLKALAVSSRHKSHSLESPTFAPATKELGFFKISVLACKGGPFDSFFQLIALENQNRLLYGFHTQELTIPRTRYRKSLHESIVM